MPQPAHIAILELTTEEESVLTLLDIFRRCGFRVSLLLSPRIWDLIRGAASLREDENLLLLDPKADIPERFAHIDRFFADAAPDLVVLPRFSVRRLAEAVRYMGFCKRYPVCAGIFNYDRWFRPFPAVNAYQGGLLKRIKIAADWGICHLILKRFAACFVSEIHRDSGNPLKQLLQQRTGGPVFDFPFKVPEAVYCPRTDVTEPVFVVPGSIAGFRRDYHMLLDVFEDPDVCAHPWTLKLLGRPIGRYGREITTRADALNARLGRTGVTYQTEYIAREDFEREQHSATHILAPVTPTGYQRGKDSGAVYDVFRFNKIGIFDSAYFYSDDLIERKVLLEFATPDELRALIRGIVRGQQDYGPIAKHFGQVSEYLRKEHYVAYARRVVDAFLGTPTEPLSETPPTASRRG